MLPRILIVQPWFVAIGHPPQSTLNTAKTLGPRANVEYLVSAPRGRVLEELASELERYGAVSRFRVPNDSLRWCTLLGVIGAVRLLRREQGIEHVFFMDAHLVMMAGCWPLFARLLGRPVSVGLIYLGGPERIVSHAWARRLVARFLSMGGTRLYLRTEELAQAWRAALPAVANRIETVPTLEIPDERDVAPVAATNGALRLGVIGQVRPGKGLEWLVPLFRSQSHLGSLRIAGAFTNPAHRAQLRVVADYPGFEDRFMTEEQMLSAAAEQDFLIALYDQWDPRMEVATFFLAARVGRPVVVYDEGWAGRIVRTFGCGVAAPSDPRPGEKFFSGLPRSGTPAYEALLHGMARFRRAHGGQESAARFLAKLVEREMPQG